MAGGGGGGAGAQGAAQVDTAEKLFARRDYAERYEMLRLLVDGIFRTVRQAQKKLMAVDLGALPVRPQTAHARRRGPELRPLRSRCPWPTRR